MLAVGSRDHLDVPRHETRARRSLTITQLVDDNGTPNNAADDFTPVYVSGDTNLNGKLDPGEVWLYQRDRHRAVLGQYTNTGAVSRRRRRRACPSPIDDTANYLGTTRHPDQEGRQRRRSAAPDRRRGGGHHARPVFPAGTTLTYTYLVFGDSALPLSRTSSTTTTPGTRDDFNAIYVSGDTNLNGKLDFGEVWLFTSAGATARRSSSPSARSRTRRPSRRRTAARSRRATAPGSPASRRSSSSVKAINAVDPAHPSYYEDANSAPGQYLHDRLDRHLHASRSRRSALASRLEHRRSPTTPAMAIAPVTKANGKNVGDANNDGLLDPGEIWIFKATGTGAAGAAHELGTVTGTDTSRARDAHRRPIPRTTPARRRRDPDRQGDQRRQSGEPDGVRGRERPDAPVSSSRPAASVVWTYMVTNLRPARNLTSVKVVDDNGTPGNPADDFVLTDPTSGDTGHERRARQERDVGLHGAGAHGRRRPLHERRHRPGHLGRTSRTTTTTRRATSAGSCRARTSSKATNAQSTRTTRRRSRTATPRRARSCRSGRPSSGHTSVSNTGNIGARPVSLRDDFGTPSNAATTSPRGLTSSGDTNGNGQARPGRGLALHLGRRRRYNAKAGSVRERRDGRRRPRPTARRDGDATAASTSARRSRMTITKAVNAADPWNPTAYEDANCPIGAVVHRRLDGHVDVPRQEHRQRRGRPDVGDRRRRRGVPGDVAFLPVSVTPTRRRSTTAT